MSQNPSLYTILSESAEPTQVTAHYVWGARPGHRDELVRRDRDTDGDGMLDERLYCLMDYFNPTAIVDETGAVVERYSWSAFGLRTVMDADWEGRSSSAYNFDFSFHGQFLDGETGYYNYGYRYYSLEIGRWLSRDLIEEAAGANLFLFSDNNSIDSIDKFGLVKWTVSNTYDDSFCQHNIDRFGNVRLYQPRFNQYPRAADWVFYAFNPTLDSHSCSEDKYMVQLIPAAQVYCNYAQESHRCMNLAIETGGRRCGKGFCIFRRHIPKSV